MLTRGQGHALRMIAREKAITPLARVSSGRADTAEKAPRYLKLPVCCRHSGFTKIRFPAM